MQYLFSQAEDRFQLREWGGYLCFLATADSAAARKFGVTAIVRMDQLIHDPHVHDDSDEIFYVLRGHGKQLLRNPDGTDTVYDIAPGDTVYLTKNRWHGTSNFSDSEQLDMLLINYFYDGQSNPAIRGVVPADSVPCEQAVFGSREWVLTPERCGTENVRGEVLTILPGKTCRRHGLRRVRSCSCSGATNIGSKTAASRRFGCSASVRTMRRTENGGKP